MTTTPAQDEATAQALLTIFKSAPPAPLTTLNQWLVAYLAPAATGATGSATGTTGAATGTTGLPPGTAGDGGPAAPTGTPQFPSLFNSYVKRPLWRVAGVDYRVGVNSNVILKKPTATNHPPGTFSLMPHPQLVIQGNDLVVDGWDFTGFEVLVGYSVDTYNVVFTNNIFDGGGQCCVNSNWGHVTNMTFKYNEFRNSATTVGVISWNPDNMTSKLTCQYNFFSRCAGDGINCHRGGSIDMRYNVYHQQGCGTQPHSDQFTLDEGDGLVFGPVTWDYNLMLIDRYAWAILADGTPTGTQGVTLNGNSHYSSWRSSGGSVSNNTWIDTSTGPSACGCLYGMWIDPTTTFTGNTWTVANNFVDDIGILRMHSAAMRWLRVSGNLGNQLGKVRAINNIDLRTGVAELRLNGSWN